MRREQEELISKHRIPYLLRKLPEGKGGQKAKNRQERITLRDTVGLGLTG